MRHPLRLALVVVGLAAVVYGAASLTGAWLGEPPWWERVEERRVLRSTAPVVARDPGHIVQSLTISGYVIEVHGEPRQGREWISGGVVAVGLGLAAVGGWPRWRRQAAAP